MKQPRVLLINHGRAGDFKGGDSVRLMRLTTSSSKGMARCTATTDRPKPVRDLVHIFNS